MAIAIVIHAMATPVHGVGIAVPVFAPVVVTAILAFLLSREYAAPLAYIGGSMGTLIGADLINLDKIGGLGAPVASIGGAGTFDGIFLTGILAVLLAGIASPSRPGLALVATFELPPFRCVGCHSLSQPIRRVKAVQGELSPRGMVQGRVTPMEAQVHTASVADRQMVAGA